MRRILIKWDGGEKIMRIIGESETHIQTGPGTFDKATKRHVLWGFDDRRGTMTYEELKPQ